MGRHEVPRRSVWLATAFLGTAGLLGTVGTAAAQVEVPELPVVSPVTVPPVTVPPVTVPPVTVPPVDLPDVNVPPLPVAVPGLPGATPPPGSTPAGTPAGAPGAGVAATAPVGPPAPAPGSPGGVPATQVASGGARESPSAGALSERRGLARAIGAVPSFVIPIAVGSLVLAFLFVQGRLDRRDPKLAAAPLTDELLYFS